MWTRLSTGSGVGISNAPSVTRLGRSLVVAWAQQSGPTTSTLNTRVVGANALPVGAVSPVLTWASISSDPQLFLLAQSSNGVTWSLGAGSLTQTRSAYGDYGIGAVDDGTGQPLVALAASSTDHVTIHHGIDPAVPADVPDTVGTATGEAQDVSLALDRVSHVGYAFWYSSRSDATNGIHTEQVWPAVTGHQIAPLSHVSYLGAPALTGSSYGRPTRPSGSRCCVPGRSSTPGSAPRRADASGCGGSRATPAMPRAPTPASPPSAASYRVP